jgi:hypothetical protein
LLTAEDRAENWVLGVILAQPNRWSHVQQAVTPQDFTNDLRRQLAEIYWAHQRDEGEPEFNELLGMLGDPALKDLAIELLGAVEAMTDLDQTLSDGLSHMQSMRRRTDERKLLAELKRTSDSTRSDTDEIELLRRLQERARQPDIRRTAT